MKKNKQNLPIGKLRNPDLVAYKTVQKSAEDLIGNRKIVRNFCEGDDLSLGNPLKSTDGKAVDQENFFSQKTMNKAEDSVDIILSFRYKLLILFENMGGGWE